MKDYAHTTSGMSFFIKTIRIWYSYKYLITSRGLFYYRSDLVNGVNYHIWSPGAYINGVMFENYYTEWNDNINEGKFSQHFPDNKNNWAVKVNRAANQPSYGFSVILYKERNRIAIHFHFLIAIFNFPLGFGSLKTIRKVLPIDLPGEPDIPSPLAFY